MDIKQNTIDDIINKMKCLNESIDEIIAIFKESCLVALEDNRFDFEKFKTGEIVVNCKTKGGCGNIFSIPCRKGFKVVNWEISYESK